ASAPVSAESDWTTRVLVGHLKPARVYWYRFADGEGNGSRAGRTPTAPLANDPRPVNFAFVSCQSVNEGKLNGYRRMIFEDERAAAADQLGFVLHLGDFIYEIVEYPDEVPTRYDRTIYDVGRIPDGGQSGVGKFHYPLTVEGYRIVYKGYLADPDLQEARARWPFVAIWDNHEFSWQGRQSTFNGGRPAAELSFGDISIPNPRKDSPPRTILGNAQKKWFMDQLRRSAATWKIWGNSLGALDVRADPQNLPDGLTKQKWPADAFAQIGSSDYGSAYHERGEIYDLVRDSKITGFAIVSGDRHSFWAGYAASRLPPAKFEPVGISFVGASLASPGAMEAYEHRLPRAPPLRSLFLAYRPAGKPEWTYNMLLKHGVRSCLEYARSFDLKRAHAVSNPKLSPHLEFVDMGGHGYATVRLTGDEMRTEFVCIPRPITRSDRPDGGPLRYRVVHTASLWKPGERPLLRQQVIEGDPGLSI